MNNVGQWWRDPLNTFFLSWRVSRISVVLCTGSEGCGWKTYAMSSDATIKTYTRCIN